MAIILIGGTGTGKSTVGKLISMNIGYKVCEIGHVVKMMFYYEMFKEYSKNSKNDVDTKRITSNYFFTNKKDLLVKKRLKYVSDKVEKYGSSYFVKKMFNFIRHIFCTKNITMVMYICNIRWNKPFIS